jgi:hypothetical protein
VNLKNHLEREREREIRVLLRKQLEKNPEEKQLTKKTLCNKSHVTRKKIFLKEIYKNK